MCEIMRLSCRIFFLEILYTEVMPWPKFLLFTFFRGLRKSELVKGAAVKIF